MTPARVFAAVVLLLPVPVELARAAGPEADRPEVRITPAVVLEAQDVKAHVTVPRRPENRRLVVTLEGPSYYTSTERQLDGDAAARMHEFAFRQLPEGEYSVRVLVGRARGSDSAAETTFNVRGPLRPLDVDGPGQRPDGW